MLSRITTSSDVPGKHARRTVGSLLLTVVLLLPLYVPPAHGQDAADVNVYIPIVGKRMCSGVVAPDLFGVQMYGETSRSTPYFDELMDSGATWVRVPVAWRSVEPVNTDVANFRWDRADRALAVATDGCLNVIATHRWAPNWAAYQPDGPVHEDDLDDLAEYLAALVERYDGDGVDDAPGSPVIRYWELYNEPDASRSRGGWGDDGDRYAEMLKTVRPKIREASREAKVLIGGLAYDWFEDAEPWPGPFRRAFLPEVVAAGGGGQFDIMNFHYFPDFAPNWQKYGPGLVGKTAAIREKMDELGLKQSRMMVTESGHYANVKEDCKNGLNCYDSSEELYMRYVPIIHTQAKAQPDIENVIWFSLHDLDDFPQETGLVEPRTVAPYKRRRTAFRAYQIARQQLYDAEYDRMLSTEETGDSNLEVHRFTDPVKGHTLYVAWRNPVRSDDSSPLYLATREATIRNVFGEVSNVKDGRDGELDGRVRISVSGRPVYIEVSEQK
jgi:hypothetical protein